MMAITGVSYRRTGNGLEPIDILNGGIVMAARKTQLSSRKESDVKNLEDSLANAIQYKDGALSAKSSRILTDEEVNNVMNPDIADRTATSIQKETFDNISNPVHYTGGRKYEPRKVIMDWGLNFYLGNVVKYISRAGRKGNALNDLMKAKQYLEWEIERLTEMEEN